MGEDQRLRRSGGTSRCPGERGILSWRTERLDVVEAELADIRGDHPTHDDSLLSREQPHTVLRRQSNLRPSHEPKTTGWDRRLDDIAAPPVPARDAGLNIGIDLGPDN